MNLVNKPHLNRVLFISFTTLFLLAATFVGVLAIDVSLILSFDGAVVGFFMGYGIPIYIHLRCLFHKYTAKEN
jgi:sodium-coupled neutral amino acid transporter 9